MINGYNLLEISDLIPEILKELEDFKEIALLKGQYAKAEEIQDLILKIENKQGE